MSAALRKPTRPVLRWHGGEISLRYDVSVETGCHIWSGAKNEHGYAVNSRRGVRRVPAARARETFGWSEHRFAEVCRRHDIEFGAPRERPVPRPEPEVIDNRMARALARDRAAPPVTPQTAQQAYDASCADYLTACFNGPLFALPQLANAFYRASWNLRAAKDGAA